ncbi:MAG: sigma-54-dependent Fis family transcriptional regulator [Planctomycetes bacterium]|nr:sigma-54-dependent Fis family transcriptional regulator [Planctomycetota bacterium]
MAMSEAAPTESKRRVLIVDDDRPQADAVAEALQRAGCSCVVVTEPRRALQVLEDDNFDLVVTDLVMHDVDGMEILRAARRADPSAEVILITGHGTIETAVQAMREGAYDYITKPLNVSELRDRVAKALEHRRLVRRTEQLSEQLQERFGFEGILGRSPAVRRVIDTCRLIAPTDTTVLIEGESGTGKELIAKALHNNSPRRDHNFVALNCAALSEGILESELFGHEKGAFTGALAGRKGRFEHADGGTLFLDEVGDMPVATQIKLLRVIENREIIRVGSNEPRKVDVRLLSATNRKLDELVRAGTFREDLYFRLKVVRVVIPPLRDRREDIPLLTDHYVRRLAAEHSRNVTGITPEAQHILAAYAWPGNVRELINTLETMVVLAQKPVLDAADIPPEIRLAAAAAVPAGGSAAPGTPAGLASGMSLQDAERTLIDQTLRATGGNRQQAAAILGIGQRTLYRKIKDFGLARQGEPQPDKPPP